MPTSTTPSLAIVPIGPATAQLAEYIHMVPQMNFARAWRRALRDDRRWLDKRLRAQRMKKLTRRKGKP